MSTSSPDDRVTTYNPVVATTDFPADFPIFDNDDIAVLVDGLPRTDFTVSSTYTQGVSTNARAVFSPGITGEIIVYGAREPRRSTQFQSGAPIPVANLNLAFNTLEAEMQEAARNIERSHRAPFGEEGGVFSASEVGNAQGYAVEAKGYRDDAQSIHNDTQVIHDQTVVIKTETGAIRDQVFAAVPTVFAPTRTAAKAIDTTLVTSFYLKEAGRVGQFSFVTGDFTTRIAGDPLEGIYIKATAVAASAGAWVRQTVLGQFPVEWWGAARDGVTSDSAAFNAAASLLNLLGGGTILASAGNYFQSATITLYNGVFLSGAGGTATVFSRTGSYGDTVSQTGGFAKITGIQFAHSSMPLTNGTATTLANKLIDGSAHIHLINTQNAEITGNTIWRMPYGVLLDGAINPRIYDNWFAGVWDPTQAAMQEGITDLAFVGTSQHGQLAKVKGNYFSGWYWGTRSQTYTDGANNVTTTNGANIGSKFNIFATSIEDLDISGNYFGRASQALVSLSLTTGVNDILIDVRIHANFFDNAGNAASSRQILTQSIAAGKRILGLSIVGNTFNGEYDTNTAILTAANTIDGFASVVNMQIVGNTFFAHTATPIILQGTVGGKVSDNTIQNYNALHVSLVGGVNTTVKSGVYVGGASDNVDFSGNIVGGGGNDGAPVAANYCYVGLTIDSGTGKRNFAHDNVYSLIDASNNPRRGRATLENQIVLTGAGNFAMTAEHAIVVVNKTTGAATTVSLPPYPLTGQEAVIKDGKGDAATNIVQVITADGASLDGTAGVTGKTITTAYGVQRWRFNGTQWNLV